MPYIPSGILYFSVWKYLLFGSFLFVGQLIFKYFELFEPYPFYGISLLCFFFLMLILWFEYGDKLLSKKWQVDKDRTNCDRLAKAFLYCFCCISWPKFV